MELKLTKPVIFFDLETTGTNITHDRIVEISLIKIMPNGEEFERTRRINPEMPIPAEATAVHHITDADVADAPKFGQIAKDLAKIFEGCDIAGFNSNKFDVPMLAEEFLRAGVKFDFTKPRYKAQLDRYDDLQNDVDYLAEFSTHAHNVDLMGRLIYDDKKREIINFGKYKGQVAADVLRRDPGYYNWIMQGDFAQNTKDVFTNIKLRLKNNA